MDDAGGVQVPAAHASQQSHARLTRLARKQHRRPLRICTQMNCTTVSAVMQNQDLRAQLQAARAWMWSRVSCCGLEWMSHARSAG